MVGIAPSAGGRASSAPAGGTAACALATFGLSWHVGGVRIVDGVDLSVAPGEFVAVIGPNGAGKTSLFNLISGLNRVSAGRIELAGRDITRLPVPRRTHAGLGRSFQSSSVFGSLSVEENVRLAVQAHRGGSMRFLPRPGADRAIADRATSILADVGLGARARATTGALAHGEKRKLEIALMLASDPTVLLLDEPMAGVSAEDVPPLVEMIRGLAADGRRSVLMVEHHMDVVLDLADRLAVMHHGSLLICDRPDVVIADPTVQSAYLGEGL